MQARQIKFDIRSIQASWTALDNIIHLHSIANEKEYDRMVSLMNCLLDATGDNEEHPLSGLLDLVGDLISRYEQDRYFIEQVEPKEVLRFLMDARGLKQEELAEIVHQSNLSAILSGKRKISATLARKFGIFFDINPAVFLPH